MVSGHNFSRIGKIYLWSDCYRIRGSRWFTPSALHRADSGRQWFILAALTLISGSATVRRPSSVPSISTSETFVFTAVCLTAQPPERNRCCS